MIWAYLIHLGANMWFDWDSPMSNFVTDGRFNNRVVCDREAWNNVTSALVKNGVNTLIIDLGEALQYESHPEISAEGAWTKEKMKSEIDRLKALGIACVPKLNFAAIHDAWMGEYSRMVSTPVYYKVVKDLIDEVCELFKPEYFHLGLDEESFREKHMQNDYGFTCIRRFDLFWHDTFFYYNCVTKNGVRPWVWSSYANWEPEDLKRHATSEPIYSPWLYERLLNPQLLPDYRQETLKGFEILRDMNFDVIPTVSTCFEPDSQGDVFEYCKKLYSAKQLKGFLTAPWSKTGKRDVLNHLNEMYKFNEAKLKYFPEEK